MGQLPYDRSARRLRPPRLRNRPGRVRRRNPRFRRGLHLIRDDLSMGTSGLGTAFIRANEAVALMNTRGGLNDPGPATATTWRLFQIVYVVANLAALAAREAPAADRLAWAQRNGNATDIAEDLDELKVADAPRF